MINDDRSDYDVTADKRPRPASLDVSRDDHPGWGLGAQPV